MPMQELRDELRTSRMPAGAENVKAFVESFLVRMTDVMSIEQRDPDVWEVNQVLAAIGAINAGWFGYAKMCIEGAMAPIEERSEEWRDPRSGVARRELIDAIGACRQRPVHDNGRY